MWDFNEDEGYHVDSPELVGKVTAMAFNGYHGKHINKVNKLLEQYSSYMLCSRWELDLSFSLCVCSSQLVN